MNNDNYTEKDGVKTIVYAKVDEEEEEAEIGGMSFRRGRSCFSTVVVCARACICLVKEWCGLNVYCRDVDFALQNLNSWLIMGCAVGCLGCKLGW